MEDIDVSDQRSIANQTINFLNEKSFNSYGLNFGTASHNSSVETTKFIGLLREVTNIEEIPAYVIFYDGFNEAVQPPLFGVSNLQIDLQAKFTALVGQNYKDLGLYSLSKQASEYSELFKRYILPLTIPNSLKPNFKGDFSEENLFKSVSCYINNIKFITAICKEFDIKPIFILQPLVTTKKPLGEIDRQSLTEQNPKLVKFVRDFYKIVRLKASIYPNFIDLSSVLDGNNRSDFRDFGHTGPYAQKDIAFAISDFILSMEDNDLSSDLQF